MTVDGGDAGGGTNNGGDDKVVEFPATKEERQQLRQARRDAERRRLVNVFVPDDGVFCTPDKTAYADLIINGHRETWPVRSQEFRHHYIRFLERGLDRALAGDTPLEALLYKAAQRKSMVNAAIEDFENRAICSALKRDVHIRVAEHQGDIYLDLGDDDWAAVRITPAGWRTVEAPPVRFIRAEGMLALPHPVRGGKVEALRPFLNVTAMDFSLAVAHLLACLRPRGPYPILDVLGPPGAAKTTLIRRLRRLVDPNAVETASPPLSSEDLAIAARNSHIQAFENVSSLTTRMSDNYCRLATGGGMRTRRRFTNTRETLFRGARPIMIEGIADIMKRPDLLDRATVFEVQRLVDYVAEEQQDRELHALRPSILGGLLDMVVCGLHERPTVRLTRPAPRLVDFALWAVACGVDRFEEAYAFNRQNAVNVLLEYDPVAKAVRALMADRRQWRGTAAKLFEAVGVVSEIRTPRMLSDSLRLLAPMLETVGIYIVHGKRSNSERPLTIERR
jgi:hypothetical protein